MILWSIANSKVWTLSGGQKQRVAILRTLMMKPEIILFDEITSALDPNLTYDVMQIIKNLQQNGMKMLIITHHLEFASKICDKIIFLSKGEILQVDTPVNLVSNPINSEVAKFLQILLNTR